MVMRAIDDPLVSELEEQARSLGFALVPLELVDKLQAREEAVADGEARGRDFGPMVRTLGHLAGVELPGAAELVAQLAADNAELRRQHAQLAREFTVVAMSLIGEEFPETLDNVSA